MAKDYKVGEKYYLPVEVIGIKSGCMFPVEFKFYDGDECYTETMCDKPDILLTAEDIATVINTERDEALEELKSRNAELEAENAEWKHNEQAYHEATEKLKAERDDLASQVGKNLAEIQALTSDVHFFKETCGKQSAAYDELKGRYDELDSVNHEQAEKIRDLDKTVAKLKDENTNLSFLLEAQPEEETTRTVHVFTNDGTEVEFRRYTSVQYRTDYNILVIKDGEEIVAGFIRGDRPGNLAYWWTE